MGEGYGPMVVAREPMTVDDLRGLCIAVPGEMTTAYLTLNLLLGKGAFGDRLPLGGNCIRLDLGTEAMTEVAGILKRSIEYSLAHRAEAVGYAVQFARDMGTELADRFVGMYVNNWTIDYGETGRQAVRELLRRGHEAGLVPEVREIDFVGCPLSSSIGIFL